MHIKGIIPYEHRLATPIEVSVTFLAHTMDCENHCNDRTCCKKFNVGDKVVLPVEEIDGNVYEQCEPYCGPECYKRENSAVSWQDGYTVDIPAPPPLNFNS